MASSSSGGHGSGDENAETVLLKQNTKGALPASACQEPTCVVNHALQHKKVAHRPLQSSLRGPRRIGEGSRLPVMSSLHNVLGHLQFESRVRLQLPGGINSPPAIGYLVEVIGLAGLKPSLAVLPELPVA
jgi:hypothetical protein